MARRLTTANLIADVRSLLDEANQTSIDDQRDILPALNRAQDVAANILAKHYQSPLLVYKTQALTTAREYPIPRDAFEGRLEKLEVQISNGLYNPLKRQSYRDQTLLETTAKTSIPMFYVELADVYRLYPGPTGAYSLRVWYLKDPLPLVLEQGTVTRVNAGDNSIIVDAIGADLTTEVDQPSSYVNFIDGVTGAIKGSAQIQSLDSRRIVFRTTPTRSTVLEQPISGSLPADLAPDDLICTVDGNCVSTFKRPFANFLIEMAVSELMNIKLQMQNTLAEKAKEEMQKIVAESWCGRESYMRVRSSNPHFERVGRRYGNRF